MHTKIKFPLFGLLNFPSKASTSIKHPHNDEKLYATDCYYIEEAMIWAINSILLFLQISLQRVADRVEKAAEISLLRDNKKNSCYFS